MMNTAMYKVYNSPWLTLPFCTQHHLLQLGTRDPQLCPWHRRRTSSLPPPSTTTSSVQAKFLDWSVDKKKMQFKVWKNVCVIFLVQWNEIELKKKWQISFSFLCGQNFFFFFFLANQFFSSSFVGWRQHKVAGQLFRQVSFLIDIMYILRAAAEL